MVQLSLSVSVERFGLYGRRVVDVRAEDWVRRFILVLWGVTAVLAGCTAAAHPSAHVSRAVAPSLVVSSPWDTASGPVIAAANSPTSDPGVGPSQVPRYRHIVVVFLENRGYDQVTASAQTPFLDSLSQQGVRLTDMHALTHPSQPNYLAMFSGSTQHVTDDSCPHRFAADNLAHQLVAHGLTFTGFAEGLPTTGFAGCSSGSYLRSHAPWTNFAGLTSRESQPLAAFPSNYASLPTVAFVVPNVNHDMHTGPLATADTWVATHFAAYSRWALDHDSLLIVTFDEDDNTPVNHIPTIFAGADLIPGTVDTPSNPYTLLRLIDDSEGLPQLGAAAQATPITATWQH